MSLRPSARIATHLLRPRVGTRPPPCTPILAIARSYSDGSDEAPAPLLKKIKDDLKTAMRAKDAARLVVLRGVISATLTASKTATKPPMPNTDIAMVNLLYRHMRASSDARDEFEAAGRSDLVEKEEAQIAVLHEYIAGSGIEVVSDEQLEAPVLEALAALGKEPKMVDILKLLQGPGGSLEDKYFDKQYLVRLIEHARKMDGRPLQKFPPWTKKGIKK
ncbi:Yqey-like protein-domain-containing protein [Nemania serpens]|nr:Yqey-like protein-domain-containing protein [Nemania serpens]